MFSCGHIVDELNKQTSEPVMKSIAKCRRASSSVFAVTLLIVVTFVFGTVYVGFIKSEIDLSWNTYAKEMSSLALKFFTINATHIVAQLQNLGKTAIEITSAYVNGATAAINSVVQIQPGLSRSVSIVGGFIKGNTYSVKLQSFFSTAMKFQINY